MDIRRYDSQNGRWQICFMDTNQVIQGETFDLNPHEGYLVYLGTDLKSVPDRSYEDYLASDRSLRKALTVPITCMGTDSKSAPNPKGYYLEPGINLIGIGQSPHEYDSDRWLEELVWGQISNLSPIHFYLKPGNTSATLFHQAPQTGSFYPHYQMFGRPAGQPCQLEEDKGYSLFLQEEVHDWQPE